MKNNLMGRNANKKFNFSRNIVERMACSVRMDCILNVSIRGRVFYFEILRYQQTTNNPLSKILTYYTRYS